MIQRHLLLVAMCCGAMAPSELSAQDSLPAWTRPLIHLRPRQELRLETGGGQIYDGRDIHLAVGTLSLTLGESDRRSFAMDSIVRAWRPGDRGLMGFLVGAGIGAGVGGGLADVGAQLGGAKAKPGDVAVGAAVFGLIFGSIGAFLGALIPHWRLIYERP